MTKPFEHWKVLPHDRVTELEPGLLTVTGQIPMPLLELPRRMTVVRLNDGRLVIYSAIALDEDEMAELEDYGRPAYLVVPGDHHRLDAGIWKERYPGMQVVAPEGAKPMVDKVVPVNLTQTDFADPNVQFITVPGTQGHEAALVVNHGSGTTLVLNDLVGNIHGESGFSGWLLRLMGFAGDEPQIPDVRKLAMVKDKAALRDQLLEWSEIDSLKRILVSHGDPIEAHPQQTLRQLADSLA